MKTTYDKARLQKALEWIKSLNARELAAEFEEFKHGCTCGSYCALVLDAKKEKIVQVNEASWSCSTDEYFNESGVLSRRTIISGKREHWTPGPDDGFEWDYDGYEYLHPKGKENDWIHSDEAQEKAEELLEAMGIPGVEISDAQKFLRGQGWEFFSVSDSPVDGWGGSEHQIREVEKDLAEWVADLESEIESATE